MADLSTLDATQPPDAQQVSQGAARIRETRDATKTSFNVEHSLAGPHAFLAGTTAGRPAAGTAGRIYINQSGPRVDQDTGSVWRQLSAFQTNGAQSAAAVALPFGAYTDIISITFADVGNVSTLIAMAVITINNVIGVARTAALRVMLDASIVNTTGDMQHTIANGFIATVPVLAFQLGISGGTHTVKVQGTTLVADTLITTGETLVVGWA